VLLLQKPCGIEEFKSFEQIAACGLCVRAALPEKSAPAVNTDPQRIFLTVPR
jgi:hypothetical protein